MGKLDFKNVKKLQGRINKEIQEYKNSNNSEPLTNTYIPKLFDDLYVLDEPAWEEMIVKHKTFLTNN